MSCSHRLVVLTMLVASACHSDDKAPFFQYHQSNSAWDGDAGDAGDERASQDAESPVESSVSDGGSEPAKGADGGSAKPVEDAVAWQPAGGPHKAGECGDFSWGGLTAVGNLDPHAAPAVGTLIPEGIDTCVGFPSMPVGRSLTEGDAMVRPTDGRLVYRYSWEEDDHTFANGTYRSALYAMHPDELVWDEAEAKWIYPPDPLANDELIPTPACASSRVERFLIQPRTGEVFYTCAPGANDGQPHDPNRFFGANGKPRGLPNSGDLAALEIVAVNGDGKWMAYAAFTGERPLNAPAGPNIVVFDETGRTDSWPSTTCWIPNKYTIKLARATTDGFVYLLHDPCEAKWQQWRVDVKTGPKLVGTYEVDDTPIIFGDDGIGYLFDAAGLSTVRPGQIPKQFLAYSQTPVEDWAHATEAPSLYDSKNGWFLVTGP